MSSANRRVSLQGGSRQSQNPEFYDQSEVLGSTAAEAGKTISLVLFSLTDPLLFHFSISTHTDKQNSSKWINISIRRTFGDQRYCSRKNLISIEQHIEQQNDTTDRERTSWCHAITTTTESASSRMDQSTSLICVFYASIFFLENNRLLHLLTSIIIYYAREKEKKRKHLLDS